MALLLSPRRTKSELSEFLRTFILLEPNNYLHNKIYKNIKFKRKKEKGVVFNLKRSIID